MVMVHVSILGFFLLLLIVVVQAQISLRQCFLASWCKQHTFKYEGFWQCTRRN